MSSCHTQHFCRAVPYDEVQEQGYNLSVSTYVEQKDTREKLEDYLMSPQHGDSSKTGIFYIPWGHPAEIQLGYRSKAGDNMPKSEMLHEFFMTCQEIELSEAFDLISDAKTDEEADFIRVVTDYVLQQKQEKAIAEERF